MMEASVKTVLLPGRFVTDQYQEHLSKAAQLSEAQYEMEHWIIIISDQRDMIQPGFKKYMLTLLKTAGDITHQQQQFRGCESVPTSSFRGRGF